MRHLATYFQHLLISLTQLLNAMMGGWPDKSTSSRAHRRHNVSLRWAFAKGIINGLFFWQPDHCRAAYESEQRRRQFSPDLR
jgi:hypothetical protein